MPGGTVTRTTKGPRAAVSDGELRLDDIEPCNVSDLTGHHVEHHALVDRAAVGDGERYLGMAGGAQFDLPAWTTRACTRRRDPW